jgi:lipopolysaccharide heptosyltransferase II
MMFHSVTVINMIKCVDKVVGTFLVALLSPTPQTRDVNYRSFLIIRPGGIGDAVLLIPALYAIQKKYPKATIDILAEKRNSQVFQLCQGINRVYTYDKPKDLLLAITRRYDVVIDSEQWYRLSAVIARITRSSLKIGYDTNERRKLFNYQIPYSHDDYEADSFLNLLVPLGITAQTNNTGRWIDIPADLQDGVDKLLRPLAGKRYVSLFPGASIAEKRWGDGRFITLAEKLNKKGLAVVIVGAENEKRIGEKIIAGRYGLNLAGKTSLIESAAVIRKSQLLVSGDSGVLHIAAGLGIPTVALFGPSNIRKWAPKGEQHIVVSRNQPCSPCSEFGNTPQCPINAKCMADIKVADVLASVDKLIGNKAG